MPKVISFPTTQQRNEYIDNTFPKRECTDVPGLYSLPDGRSLGVFCLTVTVYEKQEPDDLCDLCQTSCVTVSRTTYCGKNIGVGCGCDENNDDGKCDDPGCEECRKGGKP